MRHADMIRILMYRVGEAPVELHVANTLEEFNELVGGYIEMVRLPVGEDLFVTCNEERKLQGLPVNRPFGSDVLVGNFFVTKVDEIGDNTDLSNDEILLVTKYFAEQG